MTIDAKVGDLVIMRTGTHSGRTGTITKVYPRGFWPVSYYDISVRLDAEHEDIVVGQWDFRVLKPDGEATGRIVIGPS